MISYEEAKAFVLTAGQVRGCKSETLAMQNAVNRVCAEDIHAPMDIQPFDNSAMDGFAVRLADLGENGGALTCTGTIAAGDAVSVEPVQVGQCVEIMTGALLLLGADAVVPVELTEFQNGQVVFKARPKPGDNIRKAGEDFRKGAEVLKAGQMIHPQYIMPLAALGIDQIKVYKKPRAAFLATGSELVDDLSQNLRSGQIYNSNRPYGLVTLAAMGVECIDAPSMPDDPKRFERFLENLADKDVNIIISSGAVSAGKFDFVRKGLEQVGAEILFHKVNIKPGKPNLFARLPDGTLYFGLPGNPIATAAGLRFFVQPCLRAMMGMEEEKPVSAKAMTPFKKREGLRMFLKARAESGDDGLLTVNFLDGQESFKVSPFLSMNCWAVAPEGKEEIRVGDSVDVYPLYPQAGLL